MKFLRVTAVLTLLVAGCGRQEGTSETPNPLTQTGSPAKTISLAEARRGFQTKLLRRETSRRPVLEPPSGLFRSVRYESPAGKLAAYVSQPPGDGKRHPAIIWIVGGFSNSISDLAWEEAPPENDQTANAFRKAGLIMMYVSFRGGNDNPGFREGFYGEVDDVVAAAKHLAEQDFVDPDRIYLGGHSTGGTLALLVAASTDRFRAVFSFGPVDDVSVYGPKNLPFDVSNPREIEVRAPKLWLQSIRTPTFVLEGTSPPSNLSALNIMSQISHNPLIHFYPVTGATHFTILAPITRLLAGKILQDDMTNSIVLTEKELDARFGW